MDILQAIFVMNSVLRHTSSGGNWEVAAVWFYIKEMPVSGEYFLSFKIYLPTSSGVGFGFFTVNYVKVARCTCTWGLVLVKKIPQAEVFPPLAENHFLKCKTE